MKKLIIGLFAAILMSAGLVAFSGSTATADPYPGTVDTTTQTNANNVRQGRKATVRTDVFTAGNGTPKGHLDIVVKRDAGGFVFRTTRWYDGTTDVVQTPKLKKKGRYTVSARFDARDGSVFKNSSDSTTFRVKARR